MTLRTIFTDENGFLTSWASICVVLAIAFAVVPRLIMLCICSTKFHSSMLSLKFDGRSEIGFSCNSAIVISSIIFLNLYCLCFSIIVAVCDDMNERLMISMVMKMEFDMKSRCLNGGEKFNIISKSFPIIGLEYMQYLNSNW